MKKILSLAIISILLGYNASAQKANTDSLSLVAKISTDQLKLGKLQNTVDQKTNNKQGSALKAQNAAIDNAAAADQLSNDPENKKLARNASNKAGDAKSDARKARKENGKLNDLDKEIADLKVKIAGEQAKLNRYIPAATNGLAGPPADTTRH